MDRINVPSKNDIDKINRKLDRILRLLNEKGKPAAKKKAARKKTSKKTAKKAATRKKVAKKTTTK